MNPKTCRTRIGNKTIGFIHIPKTGGQSVQRALKMGLRRHLPVTNDLRWNELFSVDYAFAFVRNPYTRAESLFYWLATLHLKPMKRRPENAALNQWCRNTDVDTFWLNVDVDYLNRNTSGNMFRSQSWFLTKRDGELHQRVEVKRFETIEEDWKDVCQSIGKKIALPHNNSSSQSGIDRKPLGTEARKRITELYPEDFKNFYTTEK